MAASLTNSTHVLAPRDKPKRFTSYRERLDFIHENMEPTLRTVVILADDLFRDDTLWLDPPDCRFRLSFESETKIGPDREQYRYEPGLDADIELPNLERRWKIYFRSRPHDSISDRVEEEETERSTRLGISQFIENLNVDTDLGVRLRIQPEAYARAQWRRAWTPRYWVIRPQERLFYETDKGLGEVTSLTIHRWLGRKPRVFIQSISLAEFSESTEGVEYYQGIRLGKLRESLEPMDHWTRLLSDQDIARGMVLRAGVSAHSSGTTEMDSYQVGFTDRRPLYKKWIYLSLNPVLIWPRDEDWKTVFQFRISVDMLFWGSIER